MLIVDDHALVRMGISRLLNDVPDMSVVGEADNGDIALALVKSEKPDVILLDMKMPGMDGWEVIRRLTKTNPNIKIIALTALCNKTLPTRILQLGAFGYLTKESGVEEMAAAIRKVYKGERYLSAEMAQQIAMSNLDSDGAKIFEKLSEREMQIMIMITSGVYVQDIADTLFLSKKTINGYRYRLYRKLGVRNDVELTYLALKHQVIERPDE